MQTCHRCGAQAEDSMRFCIKCGAPLDAPPESTDQPVRATEHAAPASVAPATITRPETQAAVPPGPPEGALVSGPHRHTNRWMIIGAVALLLVVGLTVGLVFGLTGGSSSPLLTQAADGSALGLGSGGDSTTSTESSTNPAAAATTTTGVTATASTTTEVTVPQTPVDLSSLATLSAYDWVNRDQTLEYSPDNLVDDDSDTCWGTDWVGPNITWVQFDFASPVTVTQLRMICGYQKVGSTGDSWTRNDRVRSFVVEFSDGTSVTREVLDQRGFQDVPLPPTVTSYVRVTIMSIYPYQVDSRGWGWDDISVSELHVWGHE